MWLWQSGGVIASGSPSTIQRLGQYGLARHGLRTDAGTITVASSDLSGSLWHGSFPNGLQSAQSSRLVSQHVSQFGALAAEHRCLHLVRLRPPLGMVDGSVDDRPHHLGGHGCVAWRTCLPQEGSAWVSRLYLVWLHLVPPIARTVTRWLHSGPKPWSRSFKELRASYWSDSGKERVALLKTLLPKAATPGEWSSFDRLLETSTCFDIMFDHPATERLDHPRTLTRSSLRAFVRPWLRALFYGTTVLALGQWLAGNAWGTVAIVLLTLFAGLILRHSASLSLAHWQDQIEKSAKQLGMTALKEVKS